MAQSAPRLLAHLGPYSSCAQENLPCVCPYSWSVW